MSKRKSHHVSKQSKKLSSRHKAIVQTVVSMYTATAEVVSHATTIQVSTFKTFKLVSDYMENDEERMTHVSSLSEFSKLTKLLTAGLNDIKPKLLTPPRFIESKGLEPVREWETEISEVIVGLAHEPIEDRLALLVQQQQLLLELGYANNVVVDDKTPVEPEVVSEPAIEKEVPNV